MFHEDGQDVQVINLSILPPWVAGFRVVETKLVSCCSFWRPALGLVWGMVGQFKCAESAISPLLLCWIAGPSPIGEVLLRRCGDKRDDLLPSRYVLVNVPFVIRRPCPLAGDSLGLVSGGVVFLGLSKLPNQEDALGAPCLDTVILALHRRAFVGRGAADRLHPSLRCHTTVCYTGHQAGKR